MGRIEKLKRQAINEANKRVLGEDTDEFKRQPGSMADTLWKAKYKEWGLEDEKNINGDIDGDGIPNRLDLDADNDGELDNVDYITDLWVNYDTEDAPLHWINKRNAGFRKDISLGDDREEFNDDDWGEVETFNTWEDWKSSPYYSDKTNKSNIALAGGGSENYWNQNLRNNPHGLRVRRRKG